MKFENLYTKRQIEAILISKRLPVRFPTKKFIVEFETDIDFVTIKLDSHKSTYGEKLYHYITVSK